MSIGCDFVNHSGGTAEQTVLELQCQDPDGPVLELGGKLEK